jgi:hypothetical protein
VELDRTQQRIIGVLLEKELSTPDGYPLTVNALLAGSNQKNNRDPQMELEEFEIEGALLALREKEWVVRREGGRAPKYRHAVDQRLGIDGPAKSVLAELLLRGPQAPGALKPRVARMGFAGSPEEILAVLEALQARVPPLVEPLPRQPRERDQRWGHCLGARAPAPRPANAPAPRPLPGAAPRAPASGVAELDARIAQLEGELAELRAERSRRQAAGGAGAGNP